MEFGLQKTEKMGSPAPAGNPRKRAEAKAYRARDRMDSGWFRHDAGTPENSPSVSPARSPLRAAIGHGQQVRVNLPQICAHCSHSKQAHKNQQHVTAAGVRTEHFNRGHSPSKVRSPLPESTARMQQQIFANCSSWYRHEHTIIASDAEDQHNDQHCSPTPAWWHSDQAGGHGGRFSPHSRRVCTEAEEYYKRNHDGSTKDWYRHEHTLVEEKENQFVDVNEIGASLATEFVPSEENCIITPAGNGCCICGRLNMVD